METRKKGSRSRNGLLVVFVNTRGKKTRFWKETLKNSSLIRFLIKILHRFAIQKSLDSKINTNINKKYRTYVTYVSTFILLLGQRKIAEHRAIKKKKEKKRMREEEGNNRGKLSSLSGRGSVIGRDSAGYTPSPRLIQFAGYNDVRRKSNRGRGGAFSSFTRRTFDRRLTWRPTPG